jgi:hypothetical protein
MATLETKISAEYLGVRTGADLIKIGVKPKTINHYISLVIRERMQAIRRKIEADGLGEDVLGAWKDVVVQSGNKLSLADGVVASPEAAIGHKVMFSQEYTGSMYARTREVSKTVNKGRIGTLVGYDPDPNKNALVIKFDGNLPEAGNEDQLIFAAKNIKDIVKVSSRGTLLPKEKAEVLREEIYKEFFPHISLESKRIERSLITLLIGRPILWAGPPGSGKSTMARDFQEIMEQGINNLFVVQYRDGRTCRDNCNPFSLFDAEFSEKVPPCARCMEEYSETFKKNGYFELVPADRVKVTTMKFCMGNGIQKLVCSSDTGLDEIIGWKMPGSNGNDAEREQDESRPRGVKDGKLSLAHHGLLRIEEFGLLREAVVTSLLDPLEEKQVSIPEVRYPFPANCYIFGTTNQTDIPDAVNDRIIIITIPYPTDPDLIYRGTRKHFHKQVQPTNAYKIDDVHKKEDISLREDIPMPLPLEKAVCSTLIKYREEYQGEGKLMIQTGPRSIQDALYSARAWLFLNKQFDDNAPKIVERDYAITGVNFALCSRVADAGENKDNKIKQEMVSWIAKSFPAIEVEENSKFWCDVTSYVANTGSTDVMEGFSKEMEAYQNDISSALKSYGALRQLRASPNDRRLKVNRVIYPFMDYLFDREHGQPGIENMKESQVLELMRYYIANKPENLKCSVKPR